MYTTYLVDDDELILEDLITSVPWIDNGFEVIGSCTDSSEAIDEIMRLSPDLVFCDLKMPGMDGNELIATLKKKGAKCEFVMISAYDSFDNVRTFFKQSGFDYILKPVQIDEIQLVLERLVNRFAKGRGNGRDGEEPAYSKRFADLVEYVDANYTEKITLDMLANEFNFSKNYICNLFSKHFNTSLTCYLTEKRMNLAKELLRNKEMQMKEIAARCGYVEYVHFFKVFKEHYGISPKEMQSRL